MRRKVILSMLSAVVAVAVMAATLLAVVGPWVQTDDWNYVPGETATITGGGFAAGQVRLQVVHIQPDGTGEFTEISAFHDPWFADVNESGGFETTWPVPEDAAGKYMLLKAYQESSGLLAEYRFVDAANPSADLDQCANDPLPSPITDGCNAAAADWVNGNLGASKSAYREGDSIPYRMKFDNLSLTSHTVIIKWDTTKSSTHAIDYLTTFNRTVANANPCLGISGCNAGVFTTFAVPADPQVTGAGVTPIAGNFRLYGGAITGVSAYSYPDGAGFTGDKSAQIAITFTASVANPVLAWGGHIATRQNWGATNSAVSISGSPYHTALVDLDGRGGSQDRSLSAEAVIFPASITIIKDAVPDDAQDFAFTTTGGLSPASFSLDDDANATLLNSQVYPGILVTAQNGNSYTVTEGAVSAWTLSFGSPVCTVTTPNGGSQTGNVGTRTLSINLREGEDVSCTFINTLQQGTLKVFKHVVNDNGGTAVSGDWSIHVTSGGSDVSGSPQPGSEPVGSMYTLNGGTYNVSETDGPSGYTFTGYSGDCDSSGNVTVVPGQEKTCTLTNDDNAPGLHLRKVVTNNNGGTATVADFTLSASGPTPLSGTSPVDSGATFTAGTYALSETLSAAATGKYTASAWVCVGGTQNGANITVALGESATCTITNDDNAPALHLRKVVTNNNGGTATVADFTLSASGPTPLSGTSPVDSGATFTAGTYALSETLSAAASGRYSASSWVCVGGTQNGASITVALGESATCTITNDDIAPKLHLRKVVVNDDGGTATAASFTLTANGTGANDLSGTTPVDSGTGLLADTWALSETSLYGYSASAWVCVGGTQNGSNITVGVGGEATCTITNNDVGGTIVVIKNAKPATGSFAFTTTGAGYNGFTLTGSTAGNGNRNTQSGLDVGMYTVQESTQLSWLLTGIGGSTDPATPYACVVTGSGGSSGSGNLNTRTATIDLKNGDTVTCTFENTGNGATRTQGFWATHPELANIAWFGGSAYGHTFPGVANVAGIGDTLICGRPIDDLPKLMGGFWSDIAKLSTGAKRSALDQNRMQLLQQLLAAELNASAFGSMPSSGSFAAWETALCGTATNAINTAQQQAGSFNSAGDSSTFTPGTSANSRYARQIANIVFWNIIKP
jgi:hypothetical protein